MQKFTKFALALVMGLGAAASYADTVSIQWPEESIDATGADPIALNDGFYAVGNNSKVTLTKNGFYTGGSSSASARYMYYTPEYDGTISVEASASGDNTDRYVFVATAPGADETAATVVGSAAIPEKGVRHTATAELTAGTMYYFCLHGNGTITNVSYEYTAGSAAGWDGTVVNSIDTATVTGLSSFNNLTLTFPGASSIEILGEEECQYMVLQNEDGSEMYGLWAPTMGSEYTIVGNAITLSGFMTVEGATVAIPAGTTKLFIEDYGTLKIDGTEIEAIPTMEFNANIAGGAQPFMLTSVTNNNVEGNVAGVEASEQGVSYQFEVSAAGKALSQGTGVPTLSLMEDATVDFGAASILAFEAETAYIRFMALEQPFFTTPGTYVLSIPEGTFVDAEGTPNAEAYLKWVVIQGEEAGTFAITGATNMYNEPGEVEMLAYAFELTAANAITALHEGNITLTDANGAKVGGNAYVYGYEGEGGATSVYARFAFDTEDHMLHTPGTYTLNVPAGMFKDAEGNLSEAYNATWTVKAADSQVINLESVEVGSVTDTQYGFNDVYYTATVSFAKPAGAKYAYSEGLHMELNGENTGVPFQFGQYGMIELDTTAVVTLVYKDAMMATTNDPSYEGDFRPAGSYVAETEILFMDENYLELPVVVKFTGSVVLPELVKVEVGTPVFNVDEEPFYNQIEMGELEANGLKLTFPEAEGITPDMSIKAVATLYFVADNGGIEPYADGEDEGFTVGNMTAIPVLSDVEFEGDAMFGAPVVNFTQFVEVIAQQGGGIYAIDVKSVDVLSSNGVVASWTPAVVDGDVEPLRTIFLVTERYVIENVTAVVKQTKPNTWGDQHYTVTLTVPAAELEGLDIVKAYTEGVMFEAWEETDTTTISKNFTFMADAIEGVAVEAGKDVELVCTDAVVSQTTDTTFEGEIREEGTYPASALIVLVNANEEEVAYAEYRGELTLSKDVVTGLNKVQFNVKEVIFNLNGQRVNNANGIVVKNGVKMIIK